MVKKIPKLIPFFVEKAPDHVHLGLGDTPTVSPGKHKLCHSPLKVSKDGVADGGRLCVSRHKVLPLDGHSSPYVGVIILHLLAGVGVVTLKHLAKILHGEGVVVVVEAEINGLGDAGAAVLVHP